MIALLLIFVTANGLHLIPFGAVMCMHYNFLFILMKWNYATHLVQVEKYINWVCVVIILMSLITSYVSMIITGCFYFTIGNIHQKYRSALKSIQLLALVKNELLKHYGMNSILHFIPDIAKLEKVNYVVNTSLMINKYMYVGCNFKHYWG